VNPLRAVVLNADLINNEFPKRKKGFWNLSSEPLKTMLNLFPEVTGEL